LYAKPYYASSSSSRRLIRNKLIYFVQNIVAILIPVTVLVYYRRG
jgi:hypothetical protein